MGMEIQEQRQVSILEQVAVVEEAARLFPVELAELEHPAGVW